MTEKPKPGWSFEQDAKRYGRSILLTVVALYVVSLVASIVAAWFGKNSSDFVVICGAFWFGAVIGLLLGFLVQEAKQWDQKALTTSILGVAGSSVLLLLRLLAPTMHEIWFYPMGLVGGAMATTKRTWSNQVRQAN
jgi:Na+/citrate or Na+/malate symporter